MEECRCGGEEVFVHDPLSRRLSLVRGERVSLPDPLAARPRHCGLPVPHLAPFADEQMHGDDRLRFTVAPDGTLGQVGFVDEVPGDRDAQGVLWIRMTPSAGATAAEMGRVHPRRQRECMSGPACQVCGMTLTAEAIPWVLPLSEIPASGMVRTATPPTCLDCAGASRRLCPLLRRAGSRLCLVRGFRPWGVIGSERGGAATIAAVTGSVRPSWFPYTDTAALGRVIAEQLIVELTDLDTVDEIPAR
uniref:hypothetical protein n=1 Tax=Amycolatopsis sp. CA-096443 TaxID=3239919 RepID=UPI003F4980D5